MTRTDHIRGMGRMAVVGALISVLLLASAWLAGEGRARTAMRVKAPVRIVSLAPSVTEDLFALGLGDEVVGVTDYCDYPRAALEKPRVGGFKGKSLEAIMGLSPDLVIGTRDGNEAGLLRALARLGVRVLTVQPSTLTGVIESIRAIGRETGRERAAETLARRLADRLFETRARVRGAPLVRVLFVYGHNPLVLAGPGTFADNMIRWAGGANVAADAPTPYPRFSMETVLARAPEVIIEGSMGRASGAARRSEALSFWSRWESLPAVRDKRIVVLNQDLVARPGPRIFDGLAMLARILHPDRFEPSGGTP